MSSILTNNGAMVALQTLRSINTDMGNVQNQIATGKKVSNAADNAAVWAISKTMQADVDSFRNISSNLALGDSTVAVARQGAETVTDLLTEMKTKIVAATDSANDDERAKIQADISNLRDQVASVVGAASFNGQNLLKNTSTEEGSGTMSVLSSLNRSSSGVTSSSIDVRKRDLGTGQSAIDATGGTYNAGAASATLNATQSATIDTSSITVETGMAFSLTLFGTDANNSSFTEADLRTQAAAAATQGEAAGSDITYVAREGDTMTDVAKALSAKFDTFAAANGISSDTLEISASGSNLSITSSVTSTDDTIAVNLNTVGADGDNTIGGGLEALADIDVSTASGATKALASIEGLINTAIDSAASFGSDQRRIEIQSQFTDTISDALRSGIGTLVDADMQEASAKLQALQVQQQLAVQSLSIANSAPSQLLSLFR